MENAQTNNVNDNVNNDTNLPGDAEANANTADTTSAVAETPATEAAPAKLHR